MIKPNTAANRVVTGGTAAGLTATATDLTASSGLTASAGGQTASARGATNSTNALMNLPEQPLPLSTAPPNSVFSGHDGTVGTAGAVYSNTMQSTRSGGGVPDQVFDAHLYAQNRNMPYLNFVNHTSVQ